MTDIKTAVIIQARMSSTRLPGKSLQLIGEKPLIYYVIQRLKSLNIPIIICTSTHDSDNDLVEYLQAQEILVYRGSLFNVLERYISAAEYYNIKNIIRITGDNPLVDIKALEMALPMLKDYSYIDAIYPNGWIKGTGFELVKLSELKNINSHEPLHKEHVTLALREDISKKPYYKKLAIPSYQRSYNNIVLTCDYPQDLQTLQYVFEHFNYNTNIRIEEIIDLFRRHPAPFLKNLHYHQ
ncbi:hypothetical protein L1I30_13410 [Gillisia sp. M10.2A]|uniref:Spore coat polysaccharide biosynthesis protein SpsF n=1 Tax=Gillisia lutea TaxID=2909668 RepID=A0ABS9EKI5_9FLAO|nr:hypothetical protein [Gillisia lutea]MCF4102669.1 hypothetical protein [Gillisia lutea]